MLRFFKIAIEFYKSLFFYTKLLTYIKSCEYILYVWDISWEKKRNGGPNAFLTHIVTVRYDDNENGIPEASDLLLDNAIVYSTLNGPSGDWDLSGVTVNGVVEFKVKVLGMLHGTYEAHITNITHDVYEYAPEMDVDNPDTYYW